MLGSQINVLACPPCVGLSLKRQDLVSTVGAGLVEWHLSGAQQCRLPATATPAATAAAANAASPAAIVVAKGAVVVLMLAELLESVVAASAPAPAACNSAAAALAYS